jgi:predicted DNA-binding transcriptional regulator AlpA
MTKKEYETRFKEALARVRAERGDRPSYARRMPFVKEFTAMGRTQILDAIRQGMFPQPYKISPGGRANLWDDDELIAHREVQMAARDRQAA